MVISSPITVVATCNIKCKCVQLHAFPHELLAMIQHQALACRWHSVVFFCQVVKNGVETRQVVAVQHLQNATDGGQSLFKVKKSIASPQSARANGPGMWHD